LILVDTQLLSSGFEGDPADALLYATARELAVPFVTNDRESAPTQTTNATYPLGGDRRFDRCHTWLEAQPPELATPIDSVTCGARAW
jgi:hypothetical protein